LLHRILLHRTRGRGDNWVLHGGTRTVDIVFAATAALPAERPSGREPGLERRGRLYTPYLANLSGPESRGRLDHQAGADARGQTA